jgi:hypothetical protein
MSPLSALMGAFISVTCSWVLWGLATPGDFFAAGNPWLVATIMGAAIVGARIAYGVRSMRALITVLALCICCAAFWGLADNGWWAAAPPTRNG